MKQLNLIPNDVRVEFGGSLNRGRRKVARPLAFKMPIHFVLKAQNHWLLLRQRHDINSILHDMSKRFGVKLYKVTVNADHVHLVVRLHSRDLYRKWIRSTTSLLVRRVRGLRFTLRPYSRIVTWGKQFNSVLQYLKFNQQEADFILWAWSRAKKLKWQSFGFPPLHMIE